MELRMKKIPIQLTAEELQALVTLSENQFFRLKYIDPKMPGYKAQPEELRAAQSAVQVLQNTAGKVKAAWSQWVRRQTGAASYWKSSGQWNCWMVLGDPRRTIHVPPVA